MPIIRHTNSSDAVWTRRPDHEVHDYEKIDLVPAPLRRGSYRDYSEVDIHRLRFIANARDLGFPIEEIRTLLGLWSDRDRSSAEVKALAKARAAELGRKARPELANAIKAADDGDTVSATLALMTRELTAVHRQAHALRGVSLSVGAVRVAALADRLMKIGQRELEDTADERMADLRKSVDLSLAALESLGETIRTQGTANAG